MFDFFFNRPTFLELLKVGLCLSKANFWELLKFLQAADPSCHPRALQSDVIFPFKTEVRKVSLN